MAARRWSSFGILVASLGAFVAGFVPGCLETRDSVESPPADQACAACHGDPERAGDSLAKAAPPRDMSGNTAADGPSFPGVGAHQIHLNPGSNHAAFACQECHVVPKETGDPGHADTDRPAELVFASDETVKTIVKTGGRAPSYDAETRRCSDTYCHRDSDATWTKPRSTQEACGSCHALPPALTAGGSPHPGATTEQCVICHGEVVDKDLLFVAPELHVNGVVNVKQIGCDGCHGSDKNPAPPKDLSGNTAVTALGVGAHQAHLAGGAHSRPLQCTECHVVPKDAGDPGHADTPSPAEVNITGVAATNGRTPVWDRAAKSCTDTWCHGPTASAPSPEWTSDAGNLACTACHGQPPPFPHPQMKECSRCHGAVIETDNVTIKDRTLHVNGEVNVVPLTACTDCHGTAGQNPAPPVDLSGATATTSPGVGAHQSHLNPSGPFRAVKCEECHTVPAAWDDVGHIDTFLPAELNFSGVATRYGAAPKFTNGKCENTYCHGAVTPLAPPSGTLTVPEWTKVDGTQAACGNCHAFPPPSPHPVISSGCDACHLNVTSSLTFTAPETHVDGEVTFFVQ